MAANRSEATHVYPEWAWARYEPGTESPWNLARAGHLYRRAAFGANWEQLQQALTAGPHKTIDQLLRPGPGAAAFEQTYDAHETAASSGDSTDALCAWWLRRMILSPHPLLEKMTLFWHSHFGVSDRRVNNAGLMLGHVRLLRSEALGSFETMLRAIPSDAAVLLCTGSEANRKAAPDEGFARVLLRDYTLGPGVFTDKDVAEAARAFTGRFALRGKVKYVAREHDEGSKSILGQEGNFAADDVVDVLLNHAGTSKRIVRALYRALVSETHEPSDELIAPLVKSFAVDYDVSLLTETILRSNLFFSPVAYRQRIKSPVEYAVGIARSLEVLMPTTRLAQDLARLGQHLYHPPTTQGFEGGRYWINDATMVERYNLAAAVLQGSEAYGDKLNPWAAAQSHQFASVRTAAKFITDLFLQGDLGQERHAALVQAAGTADSAQDPSPATVMRRFTHSVITLPEFNLA